MKRNRYINVSLPEAPNTGEILESSFFPVLPPTNDTGTSRNSPTHFIKHLLHPQTYWYPPPFSQQALGGPLITAAVTPSTVGGVPVADRRQTSLAPTTRRRAWHLPPPTSAADGRYRYRSCTVPITTVLGWRSNSPKPDLVSSDGVWTITDCRLPLI